MKTTDLKNPKNELHLRESSMKLDFSRAEFGEWDCCRSRTIRMIRFLWFGWFCKWSFWTLWRLFEYSTTGPETSLDRAGQFGKHSLEPLAPEFKPVGIPITLRHRESVGDNQGKAILIIILYFRFLSFGISDSNAVIYYWNIHQRNIKFLDISSSSKPNSWTRTTWNKYGYTPYCQVTPYDRQYRFNKISLTLAIKTEMNVC